jgi:hypothetical protein
MKKNLNKMNWSMEKMIEDFIRECMIKNEEKRGITNDCSENSTSRELTSCSDTDE